MIARTLIVDPRGLLIMVSNVVALKRTALRSISVLAIVGAALAPPSAFAEPKSGGTGGSGCPVEDEHGHVSYVPVGTVIGLIHCGSDGEWHFGWLTTDLVRAPKASTDHTVTTTTITTQAR